MCAERAIATTTRRAGEDVKVSMGDVDAVVMRKVLTFGLRQGVRALFVFGKKTPRKAASAFCE